MPFRKTSNDTWGKFNPGDLVYGVESQRKHQILYGTFKENPDKAARRIDQFKVLQKDGTKEPLSHHHVEREENFKQWLSESEKYKGVVGGEYTNENIRRKDKGGIYWATMVEGTQVHFMLDGLNLLSVVKKSNTDGKGKDVDASGDTPKHRSITGSELRWIYRNRAIEGIQERVQFWLGNEPCRPPWESLCKMDELGNPAFDGEGNYAWGTEKESEDNAVALWSQYKPKVKQVDNDNASHDQPASPFGAQASPASAAKEQ